MSRRRRPPTPRTRTLTRPEIARAMLAHLSRVMRPLTCADLGRALAVWWGEVHGVVYYCDWFFRAGGAVWISEAGWRERLAGHPDLKE